MDSPAAAHITPASEHFEQVGERASHCDVVRRAQEEMKRHKQRLTMIFRARHRAQAIALRRTLVEETMNMV